MFFDEVILELEGGRGGNGFVSFHTEKYVDHGYPDGGDGGDGGNTILLSDENYNTLQHFAGKKHYKGKPGTDGFKNEMAGHGGEDMFLHVPVGTLVYDHETCDIKVDFPAEGKPTIPISATKRISNLTFRYSPLSPSSAKCGACLILEGK